MSTTGAVRLSVIVVLAVMVGAAIAAPVTPPSPVSAWLLDEGAGTTTFERSGIKTGTLYQNATFSTDTPFAYAGNHSLDLTGTSGDRAVIAGSPSGTAGTFQLWVKPNDTGAPQYLIDGTNGQRTLIYRTSATNYQLYLNQSNIGGFPASHTPTGDWTHLAVVWDTSLATEKEKVYVDGVQTNAYNVSVGARNPAQVWLGNRFSNNEPLNGKIDEYAIWSTPLSSDEIEWLAANSLHNLAVPPPPPQAPPPVPVAAWLFNEGAGTAAAPLYGSNPGTLHSNVGWSTNTPHGYLGDHALYFDGTSDNRVNFPGHHFGTQGSMQVWAYRQGGAQYLLDSSPGARTLLYAHYSLFMNNTYLGTINGELIPDNEWTQLLITWDNDATDGMRQKIYKNGDLFAYFDAVLNPRDPAMLWLGNRYSNNEPWRGMIDEYALWDVVLTPQEIGWLYQNSLALIPEPATLALLGLGLAALARRRRR